MPFFRGFAFSRKLKAFRDRKALSQTVFMAWGNALRVRPLRCYFCGTAAMLARMGKPGHDSGGKVPGGLAEPEIQRRLSMPRPRGAKFTGVC